MPSLGFGKQCNILNKKERLTAQSQFNLLQNPAHADFKYRLEIIQILRSRKKRIWTKQTPVIKKKKKKQTFMNAAKISLHTLLSSC